MIEGQYKFRIYKDGDWYLAGIYKDGKNIGITQGKTEEEIFEMIADAYMCALDVKISKWNRFWHRLLRLY